MKTHGPFRLRREAVETFYDIHSWLGILGGLALFVACFSGSLALFEQELVVWERPEVRFGTAASEQLPIDELLTRARKHLGVDRDLFVLLPSEHSGGLQARAFGDGEVERIALNPYSGRIVESPEETAFGFLTHLHTDLHLPRPFGRYLVGFLGIVLMMSLISGVMAHPKFLKDLFLLRWRPSLRFTFSELHKQVGVWGLAFGTVMAFTGAVIGLLGLFAPIMVLSAFGGDVEKATEAFSGPSFEAAGVEAEMLPLGPLVERTEDLHPGFVVKSLFIRHWGDENAEVALNLERRPYRVLVAGETHRLRLVDGEPLHVSTFTERGIGARLFGAMQPVHYALFGGMGLKLLYFISGLVLSFGIVTGSVIWLERRRPATSISRTKKDRYFWLGRLHLGVCLGLVLASAGALAAGRFAPGIVEPVFWITWLVVFTGALVVASGFNMVRMGGFATAAILVIVAATDFVTSPSQEPVVWQVDLVLLVLGFLTAAAASLCPKGAPSVESRTIVDQQTLLSPQEP